jgi:hypothetical protein
MNGLLTGAKPVALVSTRLRSLSSFRIARPIETSIHSECWMRVDVFRLTDHTLVKAVKLPPNLKLNADLKADFKRKGITRMPVTY